MEAENTQEIAEQNKIRKQQLKYWLDGFINVNPHGMADDKMAKQIADKFAAFKKWALNEIDKL